MLITSARIHPVARGKRRAANSIPVWQSAPAVEFELGGGVQYFPGSGTYQSNGYVTDADADTITITWTGSLSGVTWDGGRFVYDGVGAVGSGSQILTATDGVDQAASPSFLVRIVDSDVAQPVASGNRVLLSEWKDGPDWTFANSHLHIRWENLGGDYLDANLTEQGSTPFASCASISTGAAGQTRTWSIGTLIDRLRAENTAIYLKATTGGGNFWFASKENGTYSGPSLSVVTNQGTVNPTLLKDYFIVDGIDSENLYNNYNGQLGGLNANHIILLKFDLSVIPAAATISSATLTMTTAGSGSAAFPIVYSAFLLNPPSIVTQPETQLGGVETGIAAALASDGALSSHNSVVAYDTFESLAAINNGNWRWVPRNSGTWANGPSYTTFTDSNMPAAQITVEPGVGWGTSGNSFAKPIRVVYPPNWHNTLDGTTDNPLTPPNRPWCEEWVDIETAPTEAYLRYVIEIDEDADVGLAQDSGINMVRMARLANVLGDITDGLNVEGSAYVFSYAPSFGGVGFRPRGNPSTHGPIFRAQVYVYDYENGFGAPGSSSDKYTLEPNICFEAGKKYTIEQYVKLNTWNGQGTPYDSVASHWNSDGIQRVWINGVRCQFRSYSTGLITNFEARKIRTHEKERILFIPWGDFFAIGPINPSGSAYHLKVGAMAVTTDKTTGGIAYIGPAVDPLPTWAQGATLNAWMNVGTAKWSDIPEPSTIATAPGYCHPGVEEARLGDYSGPWYNPKTRKMVLGPAGGHGGYFHNWMTAISVGANSPAASQFHAGSPWQHMIQDSEYFGDTTPGLTEAQRHLRPTATHTYYSLRYCKERDWAILWGPTAAGNGELPLCPSDWPWKLAAPFNAPPGPWPNSRVPIVFDYNTMEWISPNQSPVAQIPIASGGNWTAFPCTADPRNGDIYYNMDGASNSGLWVWRQATNAHARLNSSNGPHNYRGTAVDPTRNQLFSTGGYPFRQGGTSYPYNQTTYGAKVFDLSTGAVTFLTMTGPAADLVCETFLLDGNNQPINDRVSYGYPEMFYCVPLGKYVLCSNPNADYPDPAKRNTTVLISIDPTSWYCDFIATTNNPGIMAGAAGVHTRFIMDETLRGALLSDQYDQPLKYIRLW